MKFQTEKNRIFFEDEQGRILAQVSFPSISETRVDIEHTFVDPCLRGQGVAGKLVRAAADEIRKTGRTAICSCHFAASWLKSHPDYADICEDQ